MELDSISSSVPIANPHQKSKKTCRKKCRIPCRSHRIGAVTPGKVLFHLSREQLNGLHMRTGKTHSQQRDKWRVQQVWLSRLYIYPDPSIGYQVTGSKAKKGAQSDISPTLYACVSAVLMMAFKKLELASVRGVNTFGSFLGWFFLLHIHYLKQKVKICEDQWFSTTKTGTWWKWQKEFLEVSSQIHIGLKFRMFFLSLSYLLTKKHKNTIFHQP